MKKLFAILAFLTAFSFVVPSFAEENLAGKDLSAGVVALDTVASTDIPAVEVSADPSVVERVEVTAESSREDTTKTAAAEQAAQLFTDVPLDSPYYAATKFLKNVGASQGYEDGRFGVGDNINRAALLKVTFIAAGTQLVPEGYITGFRDVAADAWYKAYFDTARYQGIVGGYLGQAAPDREVNLVEGLKIIALSFGYNADAYQHPTEEEWKFSANFDTKAWYVGYLRLFEKLGIISPASLAPEIGPNTILTRENVAALLYELHLRKIGKVQQTLNDLEGSILKLMQSFQYGDLSQADQLLREANDLHEYAAWSLPDNKVVVAAGKIVDAFELAVAGYNSGPEAFVAAKEKAFVVLDEAANTEPSVAQLVENVKVFMERV